MCKEMKRVKRESMKRIDKTGFNLEEMLTYKMSMLMSKLALDTSRLLEDGFGLANRDWRILALIGKHGSMAGRDLVARSPMDKATVSRAVKNLLKRKLIESSLHRSDGRIQVLALTASGRKLYSQIAPFSLARQHALLAVLTQAEQRAIYRILDKLTRCADHLLASRMRRKAD